MLDAATTRAIDCLADEDFVLLNSLVGPVALRSADERAETILTSPDEPTADGIHVWHYPFDDPVLDNLIESVGIVDMCRALLGTEALLLNNFMLWVRTADSGASLETRFHRDYPDNALVASAQSRDAIGVIIYLSDVGIEDGPTRYLPRSTAQALPIYPRWIEKETASDRSLDDDASNLVCEAGSVLVHSLLGVHRASLPTRPGRRVSMHLVLRRADAHWMGWTPWPRHADSERFRRSFGHLSPTMRGLLGWPGSAWAGWLDPAVDALVDARFGLGRSHQGR